jgi:hypothetical protein
MLKNAWGTDRLKIRTHRGEYDEALAILIKDRYPHRPGKGNMKSTQPKNLKDDIPKKFSSTIFPDWEI